jgi:hypothetical protein
MDKIVARLNKTLLAIVLTAVVLVAISILASMNNGCKGSQHEWCTPTSTIRHEQH